MLRPQAAFRNLLAQPEKPRPRLLLVFLAGILLLQFTADLLNLGDAYPVGKIMALSLILGPLAGYLVVSLGALFLMNLGCLLDGEHQAAFKPLDRTPPLPPRLLWVRIFGRKRIKEAFTSGFLRGYKRAWNRLLNAIVLLLRKVSFGRTSYARLLPCASHSAGPILLLALVTALEHIYWDESSFSASAPSLAQASLLLKGLLLAWFFLLWIPLVRVAFHLSWGQSILAGLSALLASLGLVLLVMKGIFAVPLA